MAKMGFDLDKSIAFMREECAAHQVAVFTKGISPEALDAAALRFEEAIAAEPEACAYLAEEARINNEVTQRQQFAAMVAPEAINHTLV